MGFGVPNINIGFNPLDIVNDAYNIFNNERNYRAQQENLSYQKNLQNRIFEREDSSLQRRVADAEAAGLNPQLALGSGAGAGQAISTVAPQHEPMKIDFVDKAINLQKNLTELNLLKNENIGKQKQNALLDLQKQVDEHNLKYFTDRHLPTNANGEYVQLMEALGSLIEGVKGNNNTTIGSKLHEWYKNQSKRDELNSPSHTDLPFDDDYTFEDSLNKIKSVPSRAKQWVSKKAQQLKNFWNRKK